MKTLINIAKCILLTAVFSLSFYQCNSEPISEGEAPLQENFSKAKMNNGEGFKFVTHLSGDNEVPMRETNATGQAIVKISDDETMIHYRLIVANIENVRAAHFHDAPAGSTSGVVIGLFMGPKIEGRFEGVLAEGYITAESFEEDGESMLAKLIQDMRDGNIYINVHTDRYPSGELRGQL